MLMSSSSPPAPVLLRPPMLLGPPHGSSRCAPSTQWPLYNRPPTHAAAAPPTATVSSNVAAGIVVGAGSAVSAPYSSAAATRQRDRDSDALGMRRWRLALISLLCCDAARRHMLRFRAEVTSTGQYHALARSARIAYFHTWYWYLLSWHPAVQHVWSSDDDSRNDPNETELQLCCRGSHNHLLTY